MHWNKQLTDLDILEAVCLDDLLDYKSFQKGIVRMLTLFDRNQTFETYAVGKMPQGFLFKRDFRIKIFFL